MTESWSKDMNTIESSLLLLPMKARENILQLQLSLGKKVDTAGYSFSTTRHIVMTMPIPLFICARRSENVD